tara:strand:- start:82 stop:279 length:198 start_codon:yes stop_codon:yes gene_type:complete
MTDKVNQTIWGFDVKTNKKNRIQLKTFLDRVNNYSKKSVYSSTNNNTYFVLKKDRDQFARGCRSC